MSSSCRISALVLGLVVCGGPRVTAQTTPSPQTPHTVQVTGTASVSVPPDVARLSFAVETRAREAGVASADNARIMSHVIAALKHAAFQGMEVETYGYALNPVYAPRPPQPKEGMRTRIIDGYTALNNIRVTLTDMQAVGKAVDTAVGAGANRVSSLSFAASHTTAARKEALSRAVASARSQAEAIASALGYELGPPLEIHGGAQAPPIARPMTFSSGVRAEALTPVEAGNQSVTASVTIRFALGPEKAPR